MPINQTMKNEVVKLAARAFLNVIEEHKIEPEETIDYMAMAWLREVYELLISIDASPIYGKVKDEKGKNTCGLIYWHYMASGEWLNDRHDATKKAFVVSGKSYEEAVEAALKYVLENLL